MRKTPKFLLVLGLVTFVLLGLFTGCPTEVEEPKESVKDVTITTNPAEVGALANDVEVEVTLETETEEAKIYYTIDGTAPTASSTLYSDPFTLEAGDINGKTVTVKAIGIKEGFDNSEVTSKAIVFKATEDIADVLEGFVVMAEGAALEINVVTFLEAIAAWESEDEAGTLDYVGGEVIFVDTFQEDDYGRTSGLYLTTIAPVKVRSIDTTEDSYVSISKGDTTYYVAFDAEAAVGLDGRVRKYLCVVPYDSGRDDIGEIDDIDDYKFDFYFGQDKNGAFGKTPYWGTQEDAFFYFEFVLGHGFTIGDLTMLEVKAYDEDTLLATISLKEDSFTTYAEETGLGGSFRSDPDNNPSSSWNLGEFDGTMPTKIVLEYKKDGVNYSFEKKEVTWIDEGWSDESDE